MKERLYQRYYELRAKQSECSVAERPVIQAQIVAVLALIDKLEN